MIRLKYIIINIVGTLLGGFPLPCKTGLIKIGNPDGQSPIFVTCNFCITVSRVKRVLEKNAIDCYLLVVNSRRINVWCSAAGGHLTVHDIASAVKVSGIGKLVSHRNLILPQLAAVGIEAESIRKMVGWNIIWGACLCSLDSGFY